MRFPLLVLVLPVICAYDNDEMVCLVNKERMNRGLNALGIDGKLTRAAQIHSDDQARMRRMTHDGSDGSDPAERVDGVGYRWTAVAENVAFGYKTEHECMKQWMNSPGHRKNILGHYTHFGSACSTGGSLYYTQTFGSDGRKGNYPQCPRGGQSPSNYERDDHRDNRPKREHRPERNSRPERHNKPERHNGPERDYRPEGHIRSQRNVRKTFRIVKTHISHRPSSGGHPSNFKYGKASY